MERAYLTYNKWRGDVHQETQLDHKGLSAEKIQQAIDMYVLNRDVEFLKENQRLSKLVDSLLNEVSNFKRIAQEYERYRESVDSGY